MDETNSELVMISNKMNEAIDNDLESKIITPIAEGYAKIIGYNKSSKLIEASHDINNLRLNEKG